jgi:selenocysteine-specific elongation factor
MVVSEDDQALARKLLRLIGAGRFDPPWVRDLAATVQEPEVRVREVLRKQITQNTVYQVVPDLFYDRECIRELAALVTAIAQEHGAASAARYRDIVGVGRKRAIQILEFFDRVGFTRRVHDSHLLRRDSGWETSD